MGEQKSALVVIDVQNGVVAGDRPVAALDGLLTRIASLLAWARARGVPVVYVQDDEVGEPGSSAWEIHAAIRPEPGDVRVRKLACDAFFETDLDERLRALGVAHLIVAGCKTEYCVDSTCRRAVTLGYGVTLVGDAHGTSDSAVLSSAQAIAHHNRVLDGFGVMMAGTAREIRVVPAAEVTG